MSFAVDIPSTAKDKIAQMPPILTFGVLYS